MPSSKIEGFNPLMASLPKEIFGELPDSIFNEAIKGTIQTILNSYTGFFDLFSESIQNALDAVEKKIRENNTNYSPSIWIEINMQKSALCVIDNGCGMNLKEFLLCFRPNTTFKRGQGLRGNKGVGATFLAYGYNYVKLQTKINGDKFAGVFRGGRQWAEDDKAVKEPQFDAEEFLVKELKNEESGTSIEIILQNSKTEKPKDFAYYGATTAKQWFDMLRITTPLGCIYLENPPEVTPLIHLSVIDKSGNETSIKPQRKVEYYYPHDVPGFKMQYLSDLITEVNRIEGSLEVKKARLGSDFKDLRAIHDIWAHDKLVDNSSVRLNLTDDEKELIEKYSFCVYGCMVDSTKFFDAVNKDIGLNNRKIMQGGIQLATEGMPQGELITIPLTRYSGYQRTTLIIVHFKNGNPDMGRKTFQPELKALAEKIAIRITTLLINYIEYLRPDSGDDLNITGNRQEFDWLQEKLAWRERNQINHEAIHSNFTYLCAAKEEQDVIAIYHQLVGTGIIKGLYFYRTAYNERYDGLFEYKYVNKMLLYNNNNQLGVRDDMSIPSHSSPLVIEYKYDFEAVLRDIDKEKKKFESLHLVVCWQATGEYKDNLILKPLLLENEGNVRINFAATHFAYLPGKYANHRIEVVILKELLNYLINPEEEIANQKVKYL